MASCCRTCDNRNSAVHAFPAPPSELDVCLITLHFKADVSRANSKPYAALNLVLNNIIDSEDSSSHPTTFTSWSPCLSDPRIAVIISTARNTCSSTTSPVFDSIVECLAEPLIVQHIYMDYSILSLAASSGQRVACDMIQLQAPNAAVAAAMGKHFGWDPKRSSLALHMSGCPSAAFSRPGDLVKDFWAWAELRHEDPTSPCTNASSFASSSESLSRPSARLVSWNSEEKNMSLPFPEDEEDGGGHARDLDDETLVMIFQWNSHEAADRFKHPLQASFGQNDEPVSKDLWDRHVAHPLRQLQGLGAKVVSHKLELRAVEPRLDSVSHSPPKAGRVRSGSKRLSVIASGLTEKMSGLWK